MQELHEKTNIDLNPETRSAVNVSEGVFSWVCYLLPTIAYVEKATENSRNDRTSNGGQNDVTNGVLGDIISEHVGN